MLVWECMLGGSHCIGWDPVRVGEGSTHRVGLGEGGGGWWWFSVTLSILDAPAGRVHRLPGRAGGEGGV